MLENILYLLVAIIVVYFFWYQRSLSETAKQHAVRYCEKHNVQLLSIALVKRKLSRNSRGRVAFETEYVFEFSGDGESKYEGFITLKDKHLANVDMPAFKI